MKRLRFAAVGDNCIDRFLPPVGSSFVGGNAVNVAVQLAHLGHESYYLGAVGTDAAGLRTRRLLAKNGVVTAHMQQRPGRTASTDIEIEPGGDRIFLREDFGACAGYRPSEREIALLRTMDHVHIGWMDDGGSLRGALADAGVSLSQDISVNTSADNLGLDGLTIVFCSASNERAMAETLLAHFLERGVRVGVVTLGAQGSIAATADERATVGIRTVEVIDTTGAGDSFIAGFVAAHAVGRPLRGCLEAGRDLAASTCTHVGGFRQDPQPL